MASRTPSTTKSIALDLAALPARLDDGTVKLLREISTSPLPEPSRCADDHLTLCLKSLDILPRRAMDEKGGKLAVKLYRAKLGGFSNEALSYLVEFGLERFHFYPTIAECLETLRDWPNTEIAIQRRDHATHLIQREMNARLDEAVGLMQRRELTDDQVNALPAPILMVAWTKGFLWKFTDGTFAVRPDIMILSEGEAQAAREWVQANADRIVFA
jgi:hypothetical protein